MKLIALGLCTSVGLIASGMAMTGLAATGPLADDMPLARPVRMLASGQFGRLLALRSELELTEQQRGEIREIVKSHRQEIVTVFKPLAEKRRALRDVTISEHADEAAIRAAAADLGKAIGDAAVVGSKVKAEVYKVLTPKQRQQVKDFRGQSEAAVDKFLDEAADPS
jgi:Spy/CpxP family protein refolding chaperone